MLALTMVFSVANSAVFTVSFTANPDADYTDLQIAIDAAITAGGNHEVRMQSGQSFGTNVSVNISNGTDLTISGGWNSDFTTQMDSFSSTSLYAGVDQLSYGASRVMNVNLTDGVLRLHNFAIQRGSGTGFGAGINAMVNGPSEFNLSSILCANNYAISNNSATGAGLSVTGFANSKISITESVFTNNIAESTGSTVSGAGLLARMNEQSQLTVSHSTITRNSSDSPIQVTGLGVLIDANQDAEVEFTHNYLAQNKNNEASAVLGVNAGLWFNDQSVGIIANNDVFLAQNDDTDINTSTLSQINLLGSNTSQIWFANNFIHNAPTSGIRAESRDTAMLTLINNTLYDHGGSSVFFTGGSTARFGNNIMALDGGGNFIHSNILQTNNSTANPQLLNTDEPMIADTSPARDMGNNNPWPNALPQFDFYDNNRIGNTGIVDIGAAEVQFADEIPIFADGFDIDEDE